MMTHNIFAKLLTTHSFHVCRRGIWVLSIALQLCGEAIARDDRALAQQVSPAMLQRYEAIKSAPQGEDKPLALPEAQATKVAPAAAIVEQPSALQEKVNEALTPVSLDDRIQRQALEANLKQFGYDLFLDKKSTFAPVENIPVPLDYIINPGDTFTVQVFGSTDVEYKLVVTREGKLLVPEVGDVNVGGLTFEEAKGVIGSRITKVRLGVKTVVTLTDMHTIQVILMGEVLKPGTYTISGLTSLFNALAVSGGIKTSGSLRNIEVRRQNKPIATLDLYEILMYGKASNNIYLRHGDVVYIPPIGETVSVAGEVNRPAIFEIKRESSAKDLLQLAGGPLPTADLKNAQIRRLRAPSGYTLVQVDLARVGQNTGIRNGDQLRVYPVPNRMQNVVLLSGNVLNPGGYQWRQGMRVSDLIANPEWLGQRTDFKAAALVREKSFTRRFEVQYFDLGQALEAPASASNLTLSPRDEVIVFDTHSSREQLLSETVRQLRLQATVSEPAPVVQLKGFFKHGGAYPLERNMRWLDMVRASGGLQDGVDLKYAVLTRREPVTHRLEAVRLEPQKALQEQTGDNNPILRPEDTLYLFDSRINRSELMKRDLDEISVQAGYYQPTPVVTVSGKVRQAGRFPLTPIVETMHTLAELVAYSKQRARSAESTSSNNWMRAKFEHYKPSQYLPGMNTLLEGHFGELIGREPAKHGPVLRRHGLHGSTEAVVNSFYIRAYSNIPSQDDIDAYLLACGIAQNERPESFDFLLQGYCRTNVRLDRLVSLTHLIIAGAQSDTELSHDTLAHEYKLQELLKELRASHITECATMQLAFAKRPLGLNMLRKLSSFVGFDDKHAIALSVIKSRLEVGVEQFPLIVDATQKTQRLFKTIGQVLLGGFLATEVVKSLTEWASVIYHKNNAAYFIDLERVKVPALSGPLNELLDQYYRFELVSVYASVVTVVAVIGVTLFFKLRHHNAPNAEESGSSHHH